MNAAVERYVEFFENLSPQRLDGLDGLFDDSARFKDPFNDVRGVAAIRRVFDDMYARCDAPRFRVDDVACRGDTCFLGWTFEFHRGSRGTTITGVSRVRFNTAGLAVEHVDYWDPAGQLYEGIPVIGGILKALRRRLSADQTLNPSHSHSNSSLATER
jgi:hypothetical protein